MITAVPPYILYLAATIAAMAVSIYAVKKIIFITTRRKLYDVPDDTRKIHGAGIPSLGGVGIFTGYIIVSAFFWLQEGHSLMPFILASSVILFFTGVYDDIMNMRPSKKLVAQMLASFVTVYFAHISMDSLHGLFGINMLPLLPGILLTTLCCTFFINVFNFIDGIDGLAGVLAVLYTGLLGVVFAAMGHGAIAGISFALMGATIGLLWFNIAPARIYMGDTGSMFLGFTIFIFSLLFINWCSWPGVGSMAPYIHGPRQAILLVISMLFLLIFDALRVFALRASKGISPLKADRTHLHYYLLDAGLGHTQAVMVIVGINIVLLGTGYLLQDANEWMLLLLLSVISAAAMGVVYMMRQKKIAKG